MCACLFGHGFEVFVDDDWQGCSGSARETVFPIAEVVDHGVLSWSVFGHSEDMS
jgi:hypothetical protein